MGILLADAGPTCFQGHAVSYFSYGEGNVSGEGDRREKGIAGPLHALPAIDRAGSNWDVHGNLFGEFLIRVASEAHFRWPEFRVQETLLLKDWTHLLDQKKIDGHAGIGFALQFR